MQINNACDTRTKREAHSVALIQRRGGVGVPMVHLLVSYNASRAQSFGQTTVRKIARKRAWRRVTVGGEIDLTMFTFLLLM